MSAENKENVINLTVQLYDVRVKRDGGGRVQLDFGADSLEGIQKLQALSAQGDLNFVVVMVPFKTDYPSIKPEVDPDTGEIKI